jgi:lysophospholipase L1-like esterase
MQFSESSSPDAESMSGAIEPPPSPQETSSRLRWVWRLGRLAITLAVAALLMVFFQPPTKKKLEDLALGPYTSSVRAKVEGQPIHCSTLATGEACLAAARARNLPRAVLWLGNSQVHGVNRYAPGEKTAAARLFDTFRPRGVEVQTFSQANANLQEHYVLFEWLQGQLPLAGVVVSLCYDDTREAALRAGVSPALDRDAVRRGLKTTAFGRVLLEKHGAKGSSGDDNAGLAGTLQARSEAALTGWLEDHSTIWKARAKSRARVYVSLFKLRNAAFGITATSKRPKIPARYRDNLAALAAFLERARTLRIPVQLIIAPIRNDLPLPYDMGDYRAFKKDTQALAAKHGARWSDLEGVVPTADWGEKGATGLGGGGEVDFMHFKATGHAKLAAHLAPLISDIVELGPAGTDP